jgi:hypothetical protein
LVVDGGDDQCELVFDGSVLLLEQQGSRGSDLFDALVADHVDDALADTGCGCQHPAQHDVLEGGKVLHFGSLDRRDLELRFGIYVVVELPGDQRREHLCPRVAFSLLGHQEDFGVRTRRGDRHVAATGQQTQTRAAQPQHIANIV